MKSMLMKDIGVLEYEDVPVPEIEPGGLLLKVESCALCATDIKLLNYGHTAIQYPHVLGHEIAGVVKKVSVENAGIEPGDRVVLAPTLSCGNCWLCRKGAVTLCRDKKTFGYHFRGGFAEYMAVPKEAVDFGLVLPLPGNVSFEQGAVVEPLACAIHGQNLVNTQEEDTVVVIGLGPLGCMHVAVARARGASTIIASDIRRSRVDLAQPFNADVYVDQGEDDLRETVMAETDGRGADVVIVATPAKSAIALGVEIVACMGRVSIFGGLPQTDPVVQVDANVIHYREASLHGSFSASPEDCRKSISLVASGSIDASAFITHRMGLSHVEEGMELVKQGESLKVILDPAG
jgi:L-iditol 2-dehydrogenase